MAHCDAGGRGRPPHQANANPSPLIANEQVLGDDKVAPLAKRGISLLFEPISGFDVPFEVEVIVH
jgi:hypothetical protein